MHRFGSNLACKCSTGLPPQKKKFKLGCGRLPSKCPLELFKTLMSSCVQCFVLYSNTTFAPSKHREAVHRFGSNLACKCSTGLLPQKKNSSLGVGNFHLNTHSSCLKLRPQVLFKLGRTVWLDVIADLG